MNHSILGVIFNQINLIGIYLYSHFNLSLLKCFFPKGFSVLSMVP